jgi:hypothetical protein
MDAQFLGFEKSLGFFVRTHASFHAHYATQLDGISIQELSQRLIQCQRRHGQCGLEFVRHPHNEKG